MREGISEGVKESGKYSRQVPVNRKSLYAAAQPRVLFHDLQRLWGAQCPWPKKKTRRYNRREWVSFP